MIVKEAIEPSGSVPPNPASGTVPPGATDTLALLVTGGWLTDGGKADTVAAAGLLRPWLSVAL